MRCRPTENMAVLLPEFAPGHESYNLTINFIFFLAVTAGGFLYKEILAANIKTLSALAGERKKYRKLSVAAFETVANAIEAKSLYLRGHSRRVATYAEQISKKMGLSASDVEKVYFAGLLQDVGKIGTPDVILNKPDRLTDEEFAKIKAHTTLGYEILSKFDSEPEIREAAHFHDERYDGKGYPNGISGNDIPLFSRIICVADAFDAMTSERSYRCALSLGYAAREIKECKGTQFDPEVADAMLELIQSGELRLNIARRPSRDAY